ncbi:PREDICTED: uncharacterized protein LOC108759424 [Trachymyrmex cornetzi]|uniref:uncharacterized protein LOC108759424 n=1 Tax=Trachymyrmex cornetzi TaxID=471704 RepID=UPI00084F0D24|nr:PREDICTED: uncharacterized protein LOC108759424 [Trachymyrmex cornetzi]
MPRIILTRYDIHNKEENIKVMQQINTNNDDNTNTDVLNINDTNSRIEINDLSLSSIVTSIFEKEILDCNVSNLSQFSDLLNTDVPFETILNDNSKEQSPSTLYQLPEIETYNVNDLYFAQEDDTKIQKNIIKNSSDYIQSKYSSATSNSEETEKSEHEDNSKYKEPLSNIQNDTIISTGLDVNNVGGCETRQNEQTVIPTKHAGIKKYMCIFCHKMQAKIVRHLELVHSEEDDVRKFKYLPKGCNERRKIIDTLRKKGSFEFNIKKQYEGQSFIPCRRARENKLKILKNYLACGNCKGHYLKSTLRHHFRKCTGRSGQNSRVVKVMGRR